MEKILRPTLHKIPGSGMPVAKQENHVKDLTKLTRGDLLEIKDREEHLLSNKAKLARLPDKGKRIQDFYDKVLVELERREGVNEAAAMFSVLNIASKGKETLNKLEWNGRLSDNDLLAAADVAEDVLDSDDELEMDPLRVIAQRQMHERRIKVLSDEPQLITAEDLAEIKTFATDTSNSNLSSGSVTDSNATSESLDPENSPDTLMEQHIRYVIEKTELRETHQRERFKPYKTTVSDVHDPSKERARKKGKNWENTAATPPLIEHNSAQLLTLLDSVDIQTKYLTKLKNMQEQQAAERLAAKLQRSELRKLQLSEAEVLKAKTSFTTYRTAPPLIEGDPRFNETDEVHDPLDVEQSGGVNYTFSD